MDNVQEKKPYKKSSKIDRIKKLIMIYMAIIVLMSIYVPYYANSVKIPPSRKEVINLSGYTFIWDTARIYVDVIEIKKYTYYTDEALSAKINLKIDHQKLFIQYFIVTIVFIGIYFYKYHFEK